jgi:rubredoxin
VHYRNDYLKTLSYSLKENVEDFMDRFTCTICGHIYDPAHGEPGQNIPAGIPFEKLPTDWSCPVCFSGKDKFEKV